MVAVCYAVVGVRACIQPIMSLDSTAHDVLPRWQNVPRGTLVPLGNHGGFSGADLWRIDSPAGGFALKAWPADWRSPADLAWIHSLMIQAAALPWMPRVMRTADGATFVQSQGRLWEILTWMPGLADFTQSPSSARLEAAGAALAQLHKVWQPAPARSGVCPAVVRRLDAWQTWTRLVQSGWRPAFTPQSPYQSIAEHLWQLVQRTIDEVPRLLGSWLHRELPVQPCVCDLWHDHVLFTGDRVTGIVDFGSVKLDHVAVDLARLFGSLAGEDEAFWRTAISAYERVRPISVEEYVLIGSLDRTGVILAAANWLRWLFHDVRVYPQPMLVTARLDSLRHRLSALAPR